MAKFVTVGIIAQLLAHSMVATLLVLVALGLSLSHTTTMAHPCAAKKLARVVRKLTSPELVKVASNDTLVSDCVENRHRACAVLHVDSDAVSSRDKKVVQ